MENQLEQFDVDNNKDVFAYYKDKERVYISFKLKEEIKNKLFFDHRILASMKVNNYLIPGITKWFTDKNIKMDSLEVLLFFFNEKNNLA